MYTPWGTGVGRRPASLPAQRVSVAAEFLLMGATTGSWASRIPDVRRQLSLSDPQWGLATLASTAGSLISMLTVLALIRRLGPRGMALSGAVLLVVNAPILAFSASPVRLVVGLLVQGLSTGMLAPSMNAQAVEVEKAYSRRIMSTFHACFSTGQLLGGVAGTVAARFGLSPGNQMLISGAVLLALVGGVFRTLPADPAVPSHSGAQPHRKRRFTPQLLILFVVSFLASINEGSATQWSAQYTSHTLAAGTALGAATFTGFSIAMTVSRSTGDRFVNRLGARRFVQLSEAVVVIGFGSGLLIGTTWSAIGGFVLLGLGSACVVPTLMGLAGNQPGIAAGQGVAVVSLGQWPAVLTGPPLIGALAGWLGLRAALAILVCSALAIIVLARWIRVPASPAPRMGSDPVEEIAESLG